MPRIRCFAIVLLCLCPPLCAQDESSVPSVDFEQQVAPLLANRCGGCHGAEKQESHFRVDRRSVLLTGGDYSEPAVVPHEPERSFLIEVVSGTNPDLIMPPEGERLSADEVTLLRNWIAQGAKMPESDLDSVDGLDHWSLQPVAAPTPPGGDTAASAMDAFVADGLQAAGLQFSERADRRTLIRRLYLVMHGLPPTPEQTQQFLNDTSNTAWTDVVDRVLASPRYGERWARHWLDIVRFGETHGFETNRERPNAWPYRDWVIDAFNDDKPWDEFVREQIAGDALGEPVATGFLVAGPHDLVGSPDITLTLTQRQDELADLINTTSAAFVGLTVGCARCHNHKFDPITQTDYYAVQAVFAGVQHADREIPFPPDDAGRLEAKQQQLEEIRSQLVEYIALPSAQLRPAVSAAHNIEEFPPVETDRVRFTILKTNSSQPCIDELEIFAGDQNVALASEGATARSSSNLPGYEIHKLEHINDGQYGNSRSWISNEPGTGWVEIQFAQPYVIDRIEWARDRLKQYSDRVAIGYRIEIPAGKGWRSIADSESRRTANGDPNEPQYDFDSGTPQRQQRGRDLKRRMDELAAELTALQKRRTVYAGTFAQPEPTHRLFRGDPMAKREVVAPDTIAALGSLELNPAAAEQERRLAFAEWITNPQNPLTARVIVNRLWQFHFGTGIVDTPSDFGRNGTRPTHPELLDWLAGEMIRKGWSLKQMHRLILNSRTWQQSSRPDEDAMRVDADSRLLWRFPPRRLEAEAIRDSMLAASGVLDLTMGGPGFSGFEVEMENVRHFFPKQNYGPEDWRRMIYMTKVRQEQDSVFGAFDCPDASQVMPERSRSTTPLQALNLLNSRFTMQQSELLAKRLRETAGDNMTAQITLAFELCCNRPPTPIEVDDSQAFISDTSLDQFCRVMLNTNEFLFIP